MNRSDVTISAASRPARPFGALAGRTAALLYIGSAVALPIVMVFWKALSDGPSALWEALSDEEAVAAFQLSFISAGLVTIASILLGTISAFTLVRFRFPGRKVLDALVDLPLALPTSVTGLTLAAILGPQSPIGAWIQANGWTVLYDPKAVFIAFLVVTVPFVIRAIQPLLTAVDAAEEEAAMTLGAGAWQRFRYIILPVIRPGIMTGGAIAFSRSLGEFGAVVFVAGTEPFRTQVASTLIYSRIENFDLRGASAASVVVLSLSYLLLWAARRIEQRAAGKARAGA